MEEKIELAVLNIMRSLFGSSFIMIIFSRT